MRPVHYVILLAGWIAWTLPFALRKRYGIVAQKIDVRARWGIFLQAIAYTLLWQSPFWLRSPTGWRVGLAIACFIIGPIFGWSAVFALGRQWRVDAGLNADHKLVRSGAYRVVRHPIYTSMLFLLLGTGLLVTPWLLLAAALIVFAIGTEIRVRIEDRLLAGRFGDAFQEYRRQVRAYVPLRMK